MKIKIILSLSALLATIAIFAQDVIITTNSQKIECKITEVSKSEIKYKETNYSDGPVFILSTDEINSIIYSNGKVVLYNQQAENEEKQYTETANILLLSGYTLSGELVEMTGKYVAYLDNGVRKTIPASQIKTVTLSNGQVKTYNNSSNIVEEPIINTKVNTQKKTTECKIIKIDGHYMRNNVYISTKEIEKILQSENNIAYNQWQKGDKMQIGGGICIGIGCGMVLGGLFPIIYKNYAACIGIECASLVPLGIGLGLTLGSAGYYTKAINIYNTKCNQTAVQMKWGITTNGVGLAFVF